MEFYNTRINKYRTNKIQKSEGKLGNLSADSYFLKKINMPLRIFNFYQNQI